MEDDRMHPATVVALYERSLLTRRSLAGRVRPNQKVDARSAGVTRVREDLLTTASLEEKSHQRAKVLADDDGVVFALMGHA
jgi:hypothetical protein